MAAIATALLLNSHQIYLFVIGMMLYTASANMVEIALTLFIMQVVPRREIQRFEPMRVFFMVIGFLIGPWLGIVLREFFCRRRRPSDLMDVDTWGRGH